MSSTPRSLWGFRVAVAIAVVGVAYFSRAGERYLIWATVGALILVISVIQAFGQVVLRGGSTESSDRLSRVINGPRGLWVRAGLLVLVLLFILLGIGALEL